MNNPTLNLVPREQWQAFFDDWSQSHVGELITLAGLSGDPALAKMERDEPRLPLEGISLDPRGSEAGAIIIMLGDTTEDNHQHFLRDITEVRTRSEAAVVDFSYLELVRAGGDVISVQAGDP